MPSAATVRRQIELSLEARFPAALSPAAQTVREVASTGVEAADRMLDGGLPVGAISEIVGSASSGRTSLALSFLAQRTGEGRVCAWVDVDDALDPQSAAANGVNLKQLLWVRCGEPRQSSRGHRDVVSQGRPGDGSIGAGAKAHIPAAGLIGTTEVVPGYKAGDERTSGSSGGQNEVMGGLPGRLKPRPDTKLYGESVSGSWGAVPRQNIQSLQVSERGAGSRRGKRPEAQPWTRLDQALRATDLLLQAGGFAAIVLDLADTAPEHGCRIPLATWFRFRQAADRTRCSLVLLGRTAFAQSSAAVALECGPLRAQDANGQVMQGFTGELRREKRRFAGGFAGTKKGPGSTWSADAAWRTEKRA